MRVLVLAVVCLFALGACQTTETATNTSDCINATCAMRDTEAVDATCSVEHNGQKIGFCCNNCKSKFEGLSEAEKDARVNALQKK